MPLIPALWGQRQVDLCEFEDSQSYSILKSQYIYWYSFGWVNLGFREMVGIKLISRDKVGMEAPI